MILENNNLIPKIISSTPRTNDILPENLWNALSMISFVKITDKEQNQIAVIIAIHIP